MLGHTRKHRTSSVVESKDKSEVSIQHNWRETYDDLLNETSESGLVLQGCRFREGLTQKELAKIIGSKQSHISEMERGIRPIGKQMAKKFASVFKTNYRVFL